MSETYQLELTSDNDGRFEWDGAPEEPQYLSFIKSGYENKRRQTLKPNEDNVITLRRNRKIEGQVLDATTGQPVTKFRAGLGHYLETVHIVNDTTSPTGTKRYSEATSFHADYPLLKDYADTNGQFSLDRHRRRNLRGEGRGRRLHRAS